MRNRIKVISLEKSTSRRDVFSKNNSHIHFEFFDAVDGSKLPKELIENPAFFEHGLAYSPGAYGCALSHVLLWNEAIRLNETLTIVEDDAIFRLDFEEQFSKLIDTLPSEWDIAVWGWNFDTILSLNIMPNISPVVVLFDQEQTKRSTANFQNNKENLHLLKLDQCFGTPAYSITPNGAKKFRSLCFPLTNFRLSFPIFNRELSNQGIDVAMSRIYKLTNSFCCFPPLAITQNDHTTSTVQNKS
jgi:glycosyl transferase family 25